MIFTAFFDESGKGPKGNSYLAMGGFIGHEDVWIAASEDWDARLREPPAIEYFSRHEAKTLDGQFKGFRREDAEEKLKSLARVIPNHRLQGVYVKVPHAWFRKRDSKAMQGMMGTRVYDWGFLTATSGVLQYMNKLEHDYTIDFVFDKCSELRSCIEMYDEMKESGMFEKMANAGVCIPGDDRVSAALQMADLLSGECLHLAENGPPALEPFSIIAGNRGIIHIPCDPPPVIPDLLKIQELGHDIQQAAYALCKRIYKDKEKSRSLVEDTIELQKREAYFRLEFQRLSQMHPAGWKFVAKEFNRRVQEAKKRRNDL